jgi:hypothetical protein
MKRSLLLIMLALLLCPPVSGYLIAFDVPPAVTSGDPLVIEGTSNLPPGFSSEVILYRDVPNFPSREVARQQFTIQEGGGWSAVVDTTGYLEGKYKAEIPPNAEYSYGSGSVRLRVFTVVAAAEPEQTAEPAPSASPAPSPAGTTPDAPEPTRSPEASLSLAGALVALGLAVAGGWRR